MATPGGAPSVAPTQPTSTAGGPPNLPTDLPLKLQLEPSDYITFQSDNLTGGPVDTEVEIKNPTDVRQVYKVSIPFCSFKNYVYIIIFLGEVHFEWDLSSEAAGGVPEAGRIRQDQVQFGGEDNAWGEQALLRRLQHIGAWGGW